MSEKVHRIFTNVAHNYDFVNSVFSLGTIILWRRIGAAESMVDKDRYGVLDIATGTGDLAFEILNESRKKGKDIKVTGTDFSEEMLDVARRKNRERNAGIRFELGNAMNLKYRNASFDVVTSSFALRNVDNLERFASEAKRVLKPGGKFVFMDMARPDSWPARLFLKSFWTIIGAIGLLEDKEAYLWLVGSVNRFDKHRFFMILKDTGFRNVRMRSLPSGSAFMVTGNK